MPVQEDLLDTKLFNNKPCIDKQEDLALSFVQAAHLWTT